MIHNIREQLERDEGCSLTPYKDTEGWWTIGIGHNLQTKFKAHIPAQFLPSITQNQCDALFKADETHVIHLLNIYIPWWGELDDPDSPIIGPRSGVLVNMGFNLGVPGLAQFHTFLGYMKAKEWHKAADDLKGTLVYRQLPNRYGRLYSQIISGNWV